MTDAPRYAANCSMLFTELPLLERPAAARAAGFDAIEIWWPFDNAVPADAEVDRFVDAVQDAGVQLVGLNFAAGDMPGGDRGLVSWPARSGEFRDNIAVTVGIGERLGTRVFNALYGNRIDEVSEQEQDEVATDNLALAAAASAHIDAVVLIEPVSGADREIGRLRNRSKIPLVTSVFSPMPVPMLANSTVITMMPGSTYCR